MIKRLAYAAAAMLASAATVAPADAATIVYTLTDASAVIGDTAFTGVTVTGVGDTDDVFDGGFYTALPLSSMTVTVAGTTYAATALYEFFNNPAVAAAGFSGRGTNPDVLNFLNSGFTSWSVDQAFATSAVTPSYSGYFETTGGWMRVTAQSASFTATIGSAVPEAATWSMMLIGFGAIGAALRRRGIRLAFA